MKPGGIKFESDAVVFRKRAPVTKQLSALTWDAFMYWGRPVKIDTALYPILSTQRNLAVAPDDISMPLNPDFYGRFVRLSDVTA